MSVEATTKELDEIVGRLKKGSVKFDNTLKDYERGALLKLHCAKKLNEAKIDVGADGKIRRRLSMQRRQHDGWA